jgi:hypothetical protein
MRLPAFAAIAHQPGLLQDTEMFRDGRLRDARPRRQRADRLGTLTAQPFEDGAPGGIGKRFEDRVVYFGHQTDNQLAMGNP